MIATLRRRPGPRRRQRAGRVPLALALPLLLVFTLAQAGGLPEVSQPANVPAEALLRVEIPAGSVIKYEIGPGGHIHVDRFLSMPVAYPANYGSIPGTLAGDGDPLDALVLTRAPLHPGVLIRFRPIGVLRMTDGDDDDAKIIGVPADSVDPHYAHVRELADLPPAERQRIEAFFRVYKDLPGGTGANPVRLHGFGNATEARTLIGEALTPSSTPAEADQP